MGGVVGRAIGFWVSSEIYKKYMLLSDEDKERIRHFVELLIEILSSQYIVEVREKQSASHELVRQEPVISAPPISPTSAPSVLQRIFKEWYRALIDQGFIPGQLYKCHELQVALGKKGIKEYALEALIKQGYIVREGDECVLK